MLSRLYLLAYLSSVDRRPLGNALFKFVKCTHILHFPKHLGTMTTLTSQVLKCIPLINLAFNSFFVSFITAFCFFDPSFFFSYATSWTFESTSNIWQMTFGFILGVSSSAHVKRFEFLFNKFVNSTFKSSGSPRPMNVNYLDTAPIWIFSSSSLGSSLALLSFLGSRSLMFIFLF